MVADFNGDGVDDLVVARGQDSRIRILFGGREGLSIERGRLIELEYNLHYGTGLHVTDFNGDGKADLGTFGFTTTGVGAGGPLAVYLWLQ